MTSEARPWRALQCLPWSLCALEEFISVTAVARLALRKSNLALCRDYMVRETEGE